MACRAKQLRNSHSRTELNKFGIFCHINLLYKKCNSLLLDAVRFRNYDIDLAKTYKSIQIIYRFWFIFIFFRTGLVYPLKYHQLAYF